MRRVIIFIAIWLCSIPAWAEIPASVKDSKKGVVSITNFVRKAAYGSSGKLFATGFLVDKERGIFLTNRHVASANRVNDLKLTFFNGKEIDAKLLYDDPHFDYAFLQADPKGIPADVMALKLRSEAPQLEERVYIIGNNQGQGFSFQDGIIADAYGAEGIFTGHAITISLNTKGGSSGSPILDSKGKVLALNFAGSQTFAYAIHNGYLNETLDAIVKNKPLKRHSIGINYKFFSIDEAVKFYKLPLTVADQIAAQSPDSMNKLLMVSNVRSHTPAEGNLKAGDIIYKVDNKLIGADLYKLHNILNTIDNTVKMTVFRNGEEVSITIPPYEANTRKIKRFLSFSGITFYEADDVTMQLIGVEENKIMTADISRESGMDFYGVNVPAEEFYTRLQLMEIDGKAVENFEALMALIPSLVSSKYMNLSYKNYGEQFAIGNLYKTDQAIYSYKLEFNEFTEPPALYAYDAAAMQWNKTLLSQAK